MANPPPQNVPPAGWTKHDEANCSNQQGYPLNKVVDHVIPRRRDLRKRAVRKTAPRLLASLIQTTQLNNKISDPILLSYTNLKYGRL